MQPPKFVVGQSVYTFTSLFTIWSVLDRYWDADCEVWRYKVVNHVHWLSEESLKTEEDVREILGDAPAVEYDEDEDFGDYEYDSDTGRALVDGQWHVVNSDQWDRFQRS